MHVINITKHDIPDFEVIICLIGEGPLVEKCRQLKIKHVIFENRLYNDLLVKYINSGDFDIINFHGARAVFLYNFIKHKIIPSTVVTIHSDFRYDFRNKRHKYLLYTPLYKLGLRRFENYIYLSEYIKNLADEFNFKGNSCIINNGINAEEIKVRISVEDIRKTLSIKNEAFVYIVVARLHPVKNHKNLLSAFNKLLSEFRDVYLLLLGDGELKFELMELSNCLGLNEKVKFLGFKENPVDYINGSDVNMIVSINEGGVPPLSILEGFSVKKTCIISDFPGLREKLDSSSVFILDSTESDGIYAKMKEAYTHRNRLLYYGDRCHDLLIKSFTLEKFCNSYYNYYSNILNRIGR